MVTLKSVLQLLGLVRLTLFTTAYGYGSITNVESYSVSFKGADMTFRSRVSRQLGKFRCFSSVLNWISMLSWVLRESKNIYFSKTTLLCTIFTTFSVREGLKSVILLLLTKG